MNKQFDWIDKWAQYQPDATAITVFETGCSYTWKQLNALGNFIAAQLTNDLGLKIGDRIVVLAENCIEYIVLFSVCQKTGIVLVPLNYRLTGPEIDFLIVDCNPALIFVEEKFNEKIQNSYHYHQCTHKLPLSYLGLMVESFHQSGESFDYQNIGFTEEQALFLIYTSGTTAFPKGSVYTHKMLFWNSINTELRLDITSKDKSINCAPPFHTGSWNVLETPFLHHGAHTLIMKSFDPDVVLQALEDEEISIFWAVPTMLKMMVDSPVFDKVKLQNLRYIIVGGEAMPIPLIEKWHEKGILIRQGYGLTEVGPNVTSLNHQDAIRKQGSIGTPNFYYETNIVDEQGKTVGVDEVGEFLLKGPNVTPGYWNNAKATSETIVDGWFHTGDLVRCDAEGYIYVVDRLKNMYISGAENVYPAEVEFLLRKHPAIDAVAIIGVPDEKWGEAGKAFIVLKKGVELTEMELKNYCADKLAKYKIPRHICFLTEIPKNDAGKIDRKKLKEMKI